MHILYSAALWPCPFLDGIIPWTWIWQTLARDASEMYSASGGFCLFVFQPEGRLFADVSWPLQLFPLVLVHYFRTTSERTAWQLRIWPVVRARANFPENFAENNSFSNLEMTSMRTVKLFSGGMPHSWVLWWLVTRQPEQSIAQIFSRSQS